MARLNLNRFAVVSVVAFAATGALFSAACSSDSNPSPNGPDASTGSGGKSGGTGGKSGGTGGKSTGGSTAKSDSGTGGEATGGETGDTGTGGSTSGGDSGPGTGGASGDSGTPPSSACPPTSKDFYTDKCTDSKCTAFDNSKLEKFQNGMLPDLP